MPSTNHSRASLDMMDDPESTGPVSTKLDTSGLSTLGAGEGAQITDRHNASEAASRAHENAERRVAAKKRLDGKHMPAYARQESRHGRKVHGGKGRALAVVLVAVAAVVLVLAYFGVQSCAGSVVLPSEEDVVTGLDAGTATTGREDAQDAQADATDSVTASNGVTYSLTQDADGTWQVSYADGASVLFALSGTPVALLRYGSALVVPENLVDGTWDVIAYTLVDGSEAAQLVGQDGSPVTGTGTVSSASVDGSTLVLTFSDGSTQEASLS